MKKIFIILIVFLPLLCFAQVDTFKYKINIHTGKLDLTGPYRASGILGPDSVGYGPKYVTRTALMDSLNAKVGDSSYILLQNFYNDSVTSGSDSTDVYRYTIKPNTFKYNGDKILGRYVLSVSTGEISGFNAIMYLNGNKMISNNYVFERNGSTVIIDVFITRESSSVLKIATNLNYGLNYPVYSRITGLNFNNNITLKLRLQTNTGTVTAKSGYLEYIGKSGVIVNTGGSGGSGIWGYITGTLSDQTDLNTALNGKENIPYIDTLLLTSAKFLAGSIDTIKNTTASNSVIQNYYYLCNIFYTYKTAAYIGTSVNDTIIIYGKYKGNAVQILAIDSSYVTDAYSGFGSFPIAIDKLDKGSPIWVKTPKYRVGAGYLRLRFYRKQENWVW